MKIDRNIFFYSQTFSIFSGPILHQPIRRLYNKSRYLTILDKDECDEGATCDDGKHCSNTPGSYECVGMY